MKNFFKAHFAPVIGVIVITAVIGFSMAACDDDGGSSGSGELTITGLDDYNDEYYAIAYSDYLVAAKSVNWKAKTITACNISGGQTTLNVYKISGNSLIDYDGNDTVEFCILIYNNKTNLTFNDVDIHKDDYYLPGWLGCTVKFNAGVGNGAARPDK